MSYTKEQRELLERLEQGLVWRWYQDEGSDKVLRFLAGEKLVQPRNDIQEGLFTLSERGRALLETMRQAEAAQARDKAERDQLEQARLKERAEDHAQRKREKHQDYAFNVFSILLSFLLGVFAEHFAQLIDLVKTFVSVGTQ